MNDVLPQTDFEVPPAPTMEQRDEAKKPRVHPHFFYPDVRG